MLKKVLFCFLTSILIVGLGFVAQSCLQSTVLQRADDTEDNLVLQLTIPSGVDFGSTGLTKAGSTEAGSTAESAIESLYVYFYLKNNSTNEYTPYSSIEPVSNGTLTQDGYSVVQDPDTGAYTIQMISDLNAYLTNGYSLLAVVYANYTSSGADGPDRPSDIADESAFWDGSSLNPLFFSGSDEFVKNSSGAYEATVELKRQVAKLRVKASIASSAIPSDLEIDPESVAITVSNMVGNSDVSVDVTDPGVGSGEYNNIPQISPRIVSYNSGLRYETNNNGEWESGLVLDSLYMHPIPTATESEAIKVKISMDVSSASTGNKTNITREVSLMPNTNGSYPYATDRNTIYTLDFIVQSIEGDVAWELDLGNSTGGGIEWDDASSSVNVASGEVKIWAPTEVDYDPSTQIMDVYILVSASLCNTFDFYLVDENESVIYSHMSNLSTNRMVGIAVETSDNVVTTGTYYIKVVAGSLTKYVPVQITVVS